MKGPTINIWIDKRKSLECAMIRKYLYNHKDHVIEISRGHNNKSFNPYSPGFSIYLVYLLDILIRSISSKLFDT